MPGPPDTTALIICFGPDPQKDAPKKPRSANEAVIIRIGGERGERNDERKPTTEDPIMKRREFLDRLAGVGGLTAAGGLTSLLGPLAGSVQAAPRRRSKRRKAAQPAGNPKLKRVGISSWSFHNYFHATRDKEFNPSGADLVLLDFPGMVAERFTCGPPPSSSGPQKLDQGPRNPGPGSSPLEHIFAPIWAVPLKAGRFGFSRSSNDCFWMNFRASPATMLGICQGPPCPPGR